MRVLLFVEMPHHVFNAAVRDGTAGEKLNRILDAIKPEATYFTERNGHRTAILLVNVDDSSRIPVLAEPWFLTFEANVEFHAAMLPEDLAKANLDELGKTWS